jgi:hypothetical protein
VATIGVVAIQRAGAPNLKGQLRQAKLATDVALASAAVVVARTIYDQWLASGRITDSVAPPPQLNLDGPDVPTVYFERNFLDWLDQLPGGSDGELGVEAVGQVAQIVNGAVVGEHVVDNLPDSIFDIIGR